MVGSQKPRTLYLVDGTAQVFRAFFAIRGLSNADGLPTNAVYGFAAMLLKLIREEEPDYLAVAFDLPGKTFRHHRFPDYKANRPEPPEDLNRQFPYARDVCRVLNIPILEEELFEADDLIATAARVGSEAGLQVVIVASDKDMMQLVDEQVTFLNPGKNKRLDPGGVEETFGVPPERVRDVQGLMGDTVDNIPGVPGVGEKTALHMVRTYGSLSQVLDRAERFVTAWDARDRVVEAIDRGLKGETVEPETAALCCSALDHLLELEPEGDMRDRLVAARAAAEAVAKLPGQTLTTDTKKAAREAKKTLKALDPKSARRQWYATWENRELALLCMELATLDTDAPMAVGLEEMVKAEPDRKQAAALFRGLGFKTLTEKFSDPEPEPAASETPVVSEPEPVPQPADEGQSQAAYKTVLTVERLQEAVAACAGAGAFAVDTETDGVDPMRARLVGISLSCRSGSGWYIPTGHDYLGAPEQLSLETLAEHLGPLLADPSVGKYGQNLKYDLHLLRRHGLPVHGWRLDTMVGAFILDPGRLTYKMDALSEEFLAYTPISFAEVAGEGRHRKTLNQVQVETVSRYAAEDADITFRLAAVLTERLERAGLTGLYHDLDGPLLVILAEMEARGIRIDRDQLDDMSIEISTALDLLRKAIHEAAGEPFNIDSPKQLRVILYEKLGLATKRKTAKGGLASTDAQALLDLKDTDPIAALLLEYRELTKLKGTYVDALPRLIHPETGRVHTSYHPTGAATGRLSSSDPNLQNIPARTPTGLRIRQAFVPQEGSIFLASDYSQVELRVLAHLCDDPELIAAFNAGEDIHSHTASKVFSVLPGMVTPEMRRRAKAVNFGILYGMSESRLAREQGMSRTEAKEFIKTYFQRFGRVREYIDQVRETALTEGAVRTLFGRVRYFPVLREKAGRGIKEQALRAAVNTTIQGTAADLMKMAMIRVHAALSRADLASRMLLQVHDELLLEVPQDEIAPVSLLVRTEMEGVHSLKVRLAVDQKTGSNWKEVT
ncbi:MAG: DNA polymerase I [Acidobacteria bacterium]|uniref:DNA polymerase I n=1 Tax=Candidatus Polarisedimenticola svalbardensis TaxID=2886004 RepID=A0A8J6XYS8_9BACT|nr:DNA polymerase I [Candidatus Polarisedimenticola svalbardensis]